MIVDKTCEVYKHVIEMRDIVAKLSSFEVKIIQSSFVYFDFNSVHLEYIPLLSTLKENDQLMYF